MKKSDAIVYRFYTPSLSPSLITVAKCSKDAKYDAHASFFSAEKQHLYSVEIIEKNV